MQNLTAPYLILLRNLGHPALETPTLHRCSRADTEQRFKVFWDLWSQTTYLLFFEYRNASKIRDQSESFLHSMVLCHLHRYFKGKGAYWRNPRSLPHSLNLTSIGQFWMQIQGTLKHNRSFALSKSLRMRVCSLHLEAVSTGHDLCSQLKPKCAKNEMVMGKNARHVDDEYNFPETWPLVLERKQWKNLKQ